MSGGPTTSAGREVSRQNAVTHGLSAKTLLTDILGREAIDLAYQSLQLEWRPSTPTERVLLREMARHQVALERIEPMEGAALRRGAKAALGLALGGEALASGDEEQDAALAGAGTADAVDKIARYRRPHEKGYYRSLSVLQALREAKQRPEEHSGVTQSLPRGSSTLRFSFLSDADCEAYLRQRFEVGLVPCANCGATAGRFIATRKAWQCGPCERQMSLRAGTIMAGSHIRLLAWFQAVEWVLRSGTKLIDELKNVTGLRRVGTLRRMVAEIQSALGSKESEAKLAGLETFLKNGVHKPGHSQPRSVQKP